MNVTELPTLYTEKQLAEKLGVCPATLARARRAGKIPFTMVGNRVRYTVAHLMAHIENNERCGTTSKTEPESGTSAGPTPMEPRAAHQLAREISGKRKRN